MKLNLSKIFNIKPNGGGYKTLKKLIGKYNIPVDEIKDIKKELNKQSSNGDGGGVKEYYYKLIGGEEIIGQLGPVLNKICLKSIVTSTYKNETVFVEAYMDRDGLMYIPGHLISRINDAFAISEKSTYIFQELNDDYKIAITPKGDLRTKLIGFGATEDELNAIMSCLQEITKEEYESMITYKPE